jgi:hypothetical protein
MTFSRSRRRAAAAFFDAREFVAMAA